MLHYHLKQMKGGYAELSRFLEAHEVPAMLQQCLLHLLNSIDPADRASHSLSAPSFLLSSPAILLLALCVCVFPGVVRQIATKCNYLTASTWT